MSGYEAPQTLMCDFTELTSIPYCRSAGLGMSSMSFGMCMQDFYTFLPQLSAVGPGLPYPVFYNAYFPTIMASQSLLYNFSRPYAKGHLTHQLLLDTPCESSCSNEVSASPNVSWQRTFAYLGDGRPCSSFESCTRSVPSEDRDADALPKPEIPAPKTGDCDLCLDRIQIFSASVSGEGPNHVVSLIQETASQMRPMLSSSPPEASAAASSDQSSPSRIILSTVDAQIPEPGNSDARYYETTHGQHSHAPKERCQLTTDGAQGGPTDVSDGSVRIPLQALSGDVRWVGAARYQAILRRRRQRYREGNLAVIMPPTGLTQQLPHTLLTSTRIRPPTDGQQQMHGDLVMPATKTASPTLVGYAPCSTITDPERAALEAELAAVLAEDSEGTLTACGDTAMEEDSDCDSGERGLLAM